MSATEQLRERAAEYEIRAESCIERAELKHDEELARAALGFATVAMALREVGEALREDSDS